jgi:pumilio family protein 6
MATKSAAVGTKRKSAPSTRGKIASKPKKARVDVTKSRQQPKEDPEEDPEEDSSDVSDSEDGGAKLDNESSKKGSKNANGYANGNTFERGMLSHQPSLTLANQCPQVKPRANLTPSRSSSP